MRDNQWLNLQVKILIDQHFEDIDSSKVEIKFGVNAKNRFGSIRYNKSKKISQIIINGIFKNNYVPDLIVLATIAHELCHYVHGYGSDLPKKYNHPHRGEVIPKELNARGLKELDAFEKKWTKENWKKIIYEKFPEKIQKRKVLRLAPKRKNKLLKILTSYF